jgi:hypothetical protein
MTAGKATPNPKYKTYKRGESGSIGNPSNGTPGKVYANAPAPAPKKSPKDVFFGSVPKPLPQSVDPLMQSAAPPQRNPFLDAVPAGLPQSQNIPASPSQAFYGSVPQQQPQSAQAPAPQSQPWTGSQQSPPGSQSVGSNPDYVPTPGFTQAGAGGVDPSKSYIGQTGQYQYDFWTAEGQKERVLNALDTISPRLSSTQIMGQDVPVLGEATTAMIDALNVASVLAGGAAVFRALGSMNKVGAVALTANGAKDLASTVPPWLSKAALEGAAPAAGEIATNSANAATKVNFITKILSMRTPAKATIGGVILGSGAIMSSFSGATAVRKDVSDFMKDSGELAVKLREVGLTDMADELAAHNKDLRDGFDVYIPYLPLIGKSLEEGKIQDYRDQLNAATLKYESVVKAEKEKQIAEAKIADQKAADAKAAADQAAAATRAAADVTDREDRQAFEAQQAQQKRDWQVQDRQAADQSALAQAQAQGQAQYSQDATALEPSGGSTLTFGLLNTGGGSEFVDKDKASQLYFGKVYDELTPDQRMLLNLLKKG